jgi:hypothetical protein
MLYYLTAATFQKLYDFFYIVAIFLPGYTPDTTAAAFLDMEIKAWPELPAQNGIRSDLMAACTQWIYIMEELHQIARMHHAAVWTEIP